MYLQLCPVSKRVHPVIHVHCSCKISQEIIRSEWRIDVILHFNTPRITEQYFEQVILKHI